MLKHRMLYSFWDFSLSNNFHYEVSFLCSCMSVQEVEIEYCTSKKKKYTCSVWKTLHVKILLSKLHDLLCWTTLHSCQFVIINDEPETDISFKKVSANSSLPIVILCKLSNTKISLLSVCRVIPFLLVVVWLGRLLNTTPPFTHSPLHWNGEKNFKKEVELMVREK